MKNGKPGDGDERALLGRVSFRGWAMDDMLRPEEGGDKALCLKIFAGGDYEKDAGPPALLAFLRERRREAKLQRGGSPKAAE